MQLSRDYAVTRRITLKLYIPLNSKSLNPALHISPPSSVGRALGLKSKGRWFEPAVNHYFSSNDVRHLGLYSWRPAVRMTEAWRIKKGILVWDRILIFSLFVGCLYRKGPALRSLPYHFVPRAPVCAVSSRVYLFAYCLDPYDTMHITRSRHLSLIAALR